MPADVNGPLISSRWIFSGLSSPSMMPTSPPPGMNGWSTASDSDIVRATNVAAIVCGPAVTATRMFSNRPLISRDGRGLAQVDGLDVLGPADLVLEYFLAVERENQPVPILEAFDVARAREPAEVDLVVAVGREEMLDEHAAARAERHAGDVVILVDAGLGVVDAAVALRVRQADGHLADDARGPDVLLEERRRHLQHVCDVVEAVALVVLRQAAL